MALAMDDRAVLHERLKRLITEACNRPEGHQQEIDDDEALIGPLSTLGLDSLDVLQISVALTESFGVRLEDSKKARRVLRSIRTLGEFVLTSSPESV